MSALYAPKIAPDSPWRHVAVVLALVLLACLPKLGNAFVWDDLALIVESDFIHDFSNLPRAFLHDTMFAADAGKFQAQATLDTYRPVTLVSFFVDAAISGRDPAAYHWDNLIVHLLCTALVCLFAQRLLPAHLGAAAPWAALWFGLHPVLGEAHLWINGRSDLWCTLFGLGALLLWWRDPALADAPVSTRRLLGTYLLCLLGLLSKETLAPALVAALIWDSGFFHRSLRELRLDRVFFVRSLPIVLSIGSYLVLRAMALRGLHTSAGSPQLWMAAQHLPRLLIDGLVSSVAPMRLMPRYLLEEYAAQGNVMSGLMLLLVLSIAVGIFVWRHRSPVLAFGLVWFALVLAPASLISTLPWYGFGRYLYLPFAALLPAFAGTLAALVRSLRSHVPGLVRLGVPLAALALCGFGARLSLSAPMWNGSEAFYSAIISEDATASHGLGGIGKLLVDAGKPAEAIRFLEGAVERNRKDHRYLNNLAVAYLRVGRLSDSAEVAAEGARAFPGQAKFPYVQALSAAGMGRPQEVAEWITRALRIDPNFGPARSLITDLCSSHPRREDFRKAFAMAFEADPALTKLGLLPP